MGPKEAQTEAERRPDPMFDASMILLDVVVYGGKQKFGRGIRSGRGAERSAEDGDADYLLAGRRGHSAPLPSPSQANGRRQPAINRWGVRSPAEIVSEVPPDTQKDDGSIKMTALEHCRFLAEH